MIIIKNQYKNKFYLWYICYLSLILTLFNKTKRKACQKKMKHCQIILLMILFHGENIKFGIITKPRVLIFLRIGFTPFIYFREDWHTWDRVTHTPKRNSHNKNSPFSYFLEL